MFPQFIFCFVFLKVATLQMKIISEDQAVETRTSELLFEWEKGKPVQGNTRPDVALNNLAIYEGKFSRLKEDRDNVARAKEALELMEPGMICAVKFFFLVFFLEHCKPGIVGAVVWLSR